MTAEKDTNKPEARAKKKGDLVGEKNQSQAECGGLKLQKIISLCRAESKKRRIKPQGGQG